MESCKLWYVCKFCSRAFPSSQTQRFLQHKRTNHARQIRKEKRSALKVLNAKSSGKWKVGGNGKGKRHNYGQDSKISCAQFKETIGEPKGKIIFQTKTHDVPTFHCATSAENSDISTVTEENSNSCTPVISAFLDFDIPVAENVEIESTTINQNQVAQEIASYEDPPIPKVILTGISSGKVSVVPVDEKMFAGSKASTVPRTDILKNKTIETCIGKIKDTSALQAEILLSPEVLTEDIQNGDNFIPVISNTNIINSDSQLCTAENIEILERLHDVKPALSNQSTKIHVVFLCEGCGKSCTSFKSLVKHQQMRHSPALNKVKNMFWRKSHKPKASRKRRMLIRKLDRKILKRSAAKVPEKAKRYKCNHCMKIFKMKRYSKLLIKMHMNFHKGVSNPYLCSTCGKEFNNFGFLKRHEKFHTIGPKIACEMCSQKFGWYWSLHQHQLVRPISCRICSKAMETKCELQAHRRSSKDCRQTNAISVNRSTVAKAAIDSCSEGKKNKRKRTPPVYVIQRRSSRQEIARIKAMELAELKQWQQRHEHKEVKSPKKKNQQNARAVSNNATKQKNGQAKKNANYSAKAKIPKVTDSCIKSPKSLKMESNNKCRNTKNMEPLCLRNVAKTATLAAILKQRPFTGENLADIYTFRCSDEKVPTRGNRDQNSTTPTVSSKHSRKRRHSGDGERLPTKRMVPKPRFKSVSSTSRRR